MKTNGYKPEHVGGFGFGGGLVGGAYTSGDGYGDGVGGLLSNYGGGVDLGLRGEHSEASHDTP